MARLGIMRRTCFGLGASEHCRADANSASAWAGFAFRLEHGTLEP